MTDHQDAHAQIAGHADQDAAQTKDTPAPPAPPDPPGAVAAEVMSDEQFLLAFLGRRDQPCPGCGYNLRGLRSPKCPECGRTLRLGLTLGEPFSRLWLAMTVLTSVCAGLGLTVLVITYETGDWPTLSVGQGYYLIALAMNYFVAAIPLTLLCLLTRRLFLRLKALPRIALAGIVIALNLAALGWLTWFTLTDSW